AARAWTVSPSATALGHSPQQPQGAAHAGLARLRLHGRGSVRTIGRRVAEAQASANMAPRAGTPATPAAGVVDLAARDQVLRSPELAELMELGADRGFVTTAEIEEAAELAGAGNGAAVIFARQ